MTKNQSIDILKPSSSGPDMTSLNPSGIGTMIGNPPVNAMTTPRQISMVPERDDEGVDAEPDDERAVDGAERRSHGDRAGPPRGSTAIP